MKGITKDSLKKDHEVLSEMVRRYSEAIWERQEGQSSHYDNQLKAVKISIEDVRIGCILSLAALERLIDVGIKDD